MGVDKRTIVCYPIVRDKYMKKNRWVLKAKKPASLASPMRESRRMYTSALADESNAVFVIRRGYSYPEIKVVQHAYQVPDKTFAHLIGISDKTLSRIKNSDAKLSSLSGDRLYRLKKIWLLANQVLENSENALSWLRHVQPGLNNQAPLDLLDTEPGYEQVQTLLNQIEYGVLP